MSRSIRYNAALGYADMSRDRPRYHCTAQCVFAARLAGHELKTQTLDKQHPMAFTSEGFTCAACGGYLKDEPKMSQLFEQLIEGV